MSGTGPTFVTTYAHLTGTPTVALRRPDGAPPHVAIGIGDCDIYVKTIADARALTAAFAQAAGLLEEAAGPSPVKAAPWGGALND